MKPSEILSLLSLASFTGVRRVLAGFPANFDLEFVNGTAGFSIDGISDDANFGTFVKTADVNGDGVDDLLIGRAANEVNLRWFESPGEPVPVVYVVFGASGLLSPKPSLANLTGINGFMVTNKTFSDYIPYSLNSGDISGDGIKDLLLGYPYPLSQYNPTVPGAIYVIFGSNTAFNRTISLDNLDGSNGFKINGANSGDQFGFCVSAGDIDGDSKDDLFIGAVENSKSSVYVFFGGVPFPKESALSDWNLNSTSGFTVLSDLDSSIRLGSGDINNDGKSDLFICNPWATPYVPTKAATVYVIFGGHRSSFKANMSLSDLNGQNGFMIHLQYVFAPYDCSIGVGDINGDRIQDILIGIPASRLTSDNSIAYVVFGKNQSAFNSSLFLDELDGTNGFQIIGPPKGLFASSISAGDINGDKVDDLLIGSSMTDTARGTTYVIFGKRSPFGNGTFNVADFINGHDGFSITGDREADFSGSSLSSGDVNNDGTKDLLIGAYRASRDELVYNGVSYVIFGKESFTPYVSRDLTSREVTLGQEFDYKIPTDLFVSQQGQPFTFSYQLDGGEPRTPTLIGLNSTIIETFRTLGSHSVSITAKDPFGSASANLEVKVSRDPVVTGVAATFGTIGGLLLLGGGYYAPQFFMNKRLQKGKDEFDNRVVSPIATAIAAQVKILGPLEKIYGRPLEEFKEAVHALISAIQEQGVTIDIDVIESDSGQELIKTIATQTRLHLLENHSSRFFSCSPKEATVEQLRNKTPAIAASVARVFRADVELSPVNDEDYAASQRRSSASPL